MSENIRVQVGPIVATRVCLARRPGPRMDKNRVVMLRVNVGDNQKDSYGGSRKAAEADSLGNQT